MCTLTFVARKSGYLVGMNRDEKRSRIAGLPPEEHRRGGRMALLPSEPGGGTWIGVNDLGITLALINWYAIPRQVQSGAVSRGAVVNNALPASSAAEVEATLHRMPLERTNPFRLIGVFPKTHAVHEWRWNLDRIERVDHPWSTATWISSGLDEPGACQTRGRVFCDALRLKGSGSTGWLRRIHRSHRPEQGPYSTCMHREDAVTVSYTEVRVSRRVAILDHTPGPPCCTAALGARLLALGTVGG